MPPNDLRNDKKRRNTLDFWMAQEAFGKPVYFFGHLEGTSTFEWPFSRNVMCVSLWLFGKEQNRSRGIQTFNVFQQLFGRDKYIPVAIQVHSF